MSFVHLANTKLWKANTGGYERHRSVSIIIKSSVNINIREPHTQTNPNFYSRTWQAGRQAHHVFMLNSFLAIYFCTILCIYIHTTIHMCSLSGRYRRVLSAKDYWNWVAVERSKSTTVGMYRCLCTNYICMSVGMYVTTVRKYVLHSYNVGIETETCCSTINVVYKITQAHRYICVCVYMYKYSVDTFINATTKDK